ncbi:MAG: molybdate ABC transporter substrate-binding protein [Nitrosomonadales bacterium]|nr:molybdate ABC transporter substrate-binding protein [Nitrosomonadales bacterium]
MHAFMHSIISLIALLMMSFSSLADGEPIRVAAASDLKFAVEELAASYTRKTGHKLNLTFGSSGLLATQIRHGAPFHLFMSADESYVSDLGKMGLTQDDGTLYALGRIVLIAPKNGQLRLDDRLEGLGEMLKKQTLKRFAIANPDHAPYGKRAEEALRSQDLWQSIQPYLVLGENVSQAAQFATSGSAEGGIVALSLVKSPQLASRVNYVLLSEELHQPLRQRMVLTKKASDMAKDFYRYLQQPPARAIFKRYGFELPENNS